MQGIKNLFGRGRSSSGSLSSSPTAESKLSCSPKASSELKVSSELRCSTTSEDDNNKDDPAPIVALDCKEVEQEDRKKLFSKLTGLMGKDIVSLLSLPVSLFEPTTVLQTMLEPLRFSDLLFKVSSTDDPIDRIALVAAFCVSMFSYYVRTMKPFNPVLGETFEFTPQNKAYKCVCEQVSHHPPIGVAYTKSDDWTLCQESHIQTKFWGTSVDVSSLGDNHLILLKKDDHYTWKSPSVCIHNILFGKIFVEHYGTIPIKSVKGESANVQFKKMGWFGGLTYDIGGELLDKDGVVKGVFSGKWNEYIAFAKVDEKGNKGTPVELWRRPYSESEQNHKWKFDPFLEQLTEFTTEMETHLPQTDSRLRPDLRALTLNYLKLAGKEKVQLEERERKKRREREAQGKKWNPALFKKVSDPKFEYRWEYIGNYWEESSARKLAYKEKQFAECKKNETPTRDGADYIPASPTVAAVVDEIAA